jgi:hypothetical protein
MADCQHKSVSWIPGGGLNEDAWRCDDCPEVLGFRPDLDRRATFTKVRGILLDFHESNLIYISNGTMGDIIAENVVSRCCDTNRYDQWSILAFILEDPNMASHAPFWQNRAERWLLGGEPIRDEQDALPFSEIAHA